MKIILEEVKMMKVFNLKDTTQKPKKKLIKSYRWCRNIYSRNLQYLAMTVRLWSSKYISDRTPFYTSIYSPQSESERIILLLAFFKF